MTDFSDTTVMETDGPVDAERLVPVHLASARVATERPGAERYFWWWLALIAGAGLFLRAFVVLHSQMYWVGGDGFSYSVAANLFAQGHPFVNAFIPNRPSALHPPAWSLVLGIVALLGGHDWLSQQLVACTIGTGTVVMIGVAGRRIAGARVGLVGAAIGAVYAGLWIYERDLLSETLLLLGIAATLVLAYRFIDTPSPWLAGGLGVMAGLLALIRSEQIFVWIFLVVPVVLSARAVARVRRVGWLAIATASMLIVLSSWTIYNLPRFQHLVILSNNSGSAVAQGNCRQTYYGADTGLYHLGCLAYVKTTDETVANPINFRWGVTYAEHHLSRLPVVLVAREGRSFGFWDPLQQTALDSSWQKTPLWVNRLALFTYWLLLLPAIAGIVVLRRRRRALYPLLAFGATVVVATATTYGETRLRAAVEVPLVLLAAVGIEAGLRFVRGPGRAHNGQVAGGPVPSARPEVVATPQLSPGGRLRGTTVLTSGVAPRIALSVVAVIATFSLFAAGVGAVVAAATLNSPTAFHVLVPANDATISGEQILDATTPFNGSVKTLSFQVQHGDLKKTVLPGTLTAYGWLGQWNTSTVPDGTYRIWAVVSSNSGDFLRSPSISVVVKNR